MPVLFVVETGLGAGLGLDENGVAGLGECFDAGGSDTDACLVVLDFFGDANDHDLLQSNPRFDARWRASIPNEQRRRFHFLGEGLAAPRFEDIRTAENSTS